jgi:2,4-dienoyl-CoA reductase-like NADH-dependent reductase (Old Yellow Enzyme family)
VKISRIIEQAKKAKKLIIVKKCQRKWPGAKESMAKAKAMAAESEENVAKLWHLSKWHVSINENINIENESEISENNRKLERKSISIIMALKMAKHQ